MESLKMSCYHDKETNKRLIINLKFDQLKGHSLDSDITDSSRNIIVTMPEEYNIF